MRVEKIEIQGLSTVYRVVIEEIIITDEKHIEKCKYYESINYHTMVRCIACKYSREKLFVDCVDELVRLETSNKLSNEEKRQTLIHFINQHFRIIYGN